jgi:hypothetical protein
MEEVMNKVYSVLFLVIALSLSACGKGDPGDPGAQGPAGPAGEVGPQGPEGPAYVPPTPSPSDPVQDEIDAMISDKNDERAVTALAPLTKGLACTVQAVQSGQCLSSSGLSATQAGCTAPNVVVMTGTSYTYLYKGSFNQPETSGGDPSVLLPPALRPLFVGKNFRISCSGFIVVTESNYYDFSLNSDDGSILTVNNSQVVNNDNNHGMTIRYGSALLYRGILQFSLQYAQTGGGNYGLVLQTGGSSIDPRFLYH